MIKRLEFVVLASEAGIDFRQLCRRFGISAKTGYKWRKRHRAGGAAALEDQSRRPHRSPKRCAEAVAEAVIGLRREHPTWGGRKLRRRLQDLQQAGAPSASTCTEILRRAQLLTPEASAARTPFQRFERPQPNDLWQMDFKGHFATQAGPRCHPLTVLDDHSRFNLVLSPEADETGPGVQAALQSAFAQYGLPETILCDNGPPWGCAAPTCPYTALTVWLLRWGVRVVHGRPYHPQTQGKDERFHRTLGDDLIVQPTWRDLAHCATEFPRFRHCYNCERPHDSLQGATPVSRYRLSPRALPASLPAIDYPAGTSVRLLPPTGRFMFGGQTWYVGWAFRGLPIGLRP
ncbi:MAG: Integrase catalytic region, partial [Lacunisphaera sp.]|nr:Integrase catalytic region [Lacunisphaera sp.]